jgi:[protein-PII] uridylyltransferase
MALETSDGATTPAPWSPADLVAARAHVLETHPRPGRAARSALAEVTDSWLAGLVLSAAGRDADIALVAVGGHGRGELLPGSDLDLLLLHAPSVDVATIADKLWYPIWDAGLKLDHSVRTVPEARRTASKDLKVLMGLLDARLLAGDDRLLDQLRAGVLADWRALAPQRLGELFESVNERRARAGELAHLVEPDLKESYGGLRDLAVLRAIAASWVTDVPHETVRVAAGSILDAREALHRVTGKSTDRLVREVQPEIATLLSFENAEALRRDVGLAGRSIAHASDVVWHRVRRQGRGGVRRLRSLRDNPGRTPLVDGAVVQDGEVVLARDAKPATDPVLALRAAAAAAQSGLLLSPHTVNRLATESAPLPVPWPRPARDAFISLLGAGKASVPVWEALDQSGLLVTWIPEWEIVRGLPQDSRVHVWTVDRHLIQTAVEASTLTRESDRPDLLLLGALLHDIGKGMPGDHSEAGASLVPSIAARIGLDDADVDLLAQLVAQHLLLSETATRRDPGDPATARIVADQVGTARALHLLHLLTQADARATGPTVWTEWRAELVADLVRRAQALLAGEEVPPLPTLTEEEKSLATVTTVTVQLAPSGAGGYRVAVGAPDSIGLLATLAGVLSLHRLAVRSAHTLTVGTVAVAVCDVEPMFGDPPDAKRLEQDLRGALGGQIDLQARLAAREPAAVADAPAARVEILADVSDNATVLEVRAQDAPGLLHRVAGAVSSTGVDVRAARVDTLGSSVIDVFYLVSPDGAPLDPAVALSVRDTVAEALA